MRWNEAIYWLMAMILIGSAGVGCVSQGEGGGDGWGICDDCDGAADPQVVEPDEVPVGEQEDVAPTRLSELEPCAPRAVGLRVDNVPELPAEVVDGHCPLEQKSYDNDGDGESERVTRWTRHGDMIEQVIEDRGGVWKETTFEVDAAGELSRVHQRQYNLYYGAGHMDQEWTFDGRGRLTSYTKQRWLEEDGVDILQSAHQIDQTWRDGRLVARTEDRSYGERDTRKAYEWRYDERGQLAEALVNASPSGASQRSVWTYEDGRPVAVERSLDEVTTVRHEWQYHDGGVVAAHDVEYGPHGLGESAADIYATSADVVDTYHTPSPYVLYSPYSQVRSPWRAANPQVDAQRECYTLPSSAGHGYPHDEPAYRLGWAEATEGIRFSSSYGSHGYAYGYGEPLWYGHAGVGTPWPAGQYGANGVLTAQLEYDARGRMVGETLNLAPYASDGAEAGSQQGVPEPTRIERRRRFGETGLLDDQITVETVEETHERRLSFERSPEGHILQRELLGEDGRLAFQTWAYDRESRVTGHGVHIAEHDQQYRMTLPDLLRADFEEPAHTGSYERRFDERGRVEFVGAEEHRDTTQFTEITIDHGEHGPLEETRTYSSENGESASRTTYGYDDAGRKVSERRDYDGDGTIDAATDYVYEGDRLVEVIEANGNTTRVTGMSYVCE